VNLRFANGTIKIIQEGSHRIADSCNVYDLLYSLKLNIIFVYQIKAL
jgi:hypothetical protein